MKKIEWQGEKTCTKCGYSSGKFPCFDGIDFCPICKAWGDAIVPTNAESCNICYEPAITGSDGLCDKCRKEQNKEEWEDDYYKTVEEESTREAVGFEDDAKRLAGIWYCLDCGYSGNEKEFKMIDEYNIQCPQCQGINTSPAISPRLTVCENENCGAVIPVEIAEKNYGFCDLCRETEEKRIEEETETLKPLLKELFF